MCAFDNVEKKANGSENKEKRCEGTIVINELGVDISKTSIPVVPEPHYLCGGVKTDKHGGTSIKNLFGLGETACTGLRGGNRLASNSILEAVLYAENAFQYCKENWQKVNRSRYISTSDYQRIEREDIDEKYK